MTAQSEGRELMIHQKRVFSSRYGEGSVRVMLLVTLCILLIGAVDVFSDVIIGRQWAETAPIIDGIVSSGEWNSARLTTIPHGKLRTMNDGRFLYMLVDVVDDTGNDPVGSDHYVLAFDVDLNYAVTPNVDLIYDSCQDGRPFVKSYYLSEHAFTGCRTTSRLSLGVFGFGSTLHSKTPHRFYEFRLDFNEIGVDPATWTTSSGQTSKVRVNIGTVSQKPLFSVASPDNDLFPDFTKDLYRIDLATFPSYEPGTAGPTFAGVGLVPSTFIDGEGYANINDPSYYVATNAPFGGKLNIFGNWAALRSLGATWYRVRYSKNGGPLTNLIQTWTNYRYKKVGGVYQWIAAAIGPSSSGMYSIPSPSETWYLPNLIISWQSSEFPDGTYVLSLELFNSNGTPLPDPPGNSLTLFVVNTPPTVKINQILYNGSAVKACEIVEQGPGSNDGFQFNISVNDVRGALSYFSLYGYYGDDKSSYVYSDTYASHMATVGKVWEGVTNLVVPVNSLWRAPTSCAYTFILSAASRSQNGYGLVFPYVGYHMSLTIETSGSVKGGECDQEPSLDEELPGCMPSGLR